MEHPREETLRRFVAGTASRKESLATVAHLLKGCSPCACQIRQLMQPEQVCRNAYEPALDRFDHGLVEALESSISPIQTLRTVLTQLLEVDGDPPPDRPKHRQRQN